MGRQVLRSERHKLQHLGCQLVGLGLRRFKVWGFRAFGGWGFVPGLLVFAGPRIQDGFLNGNFLGLWIQDSRVQVRTFRVVLELAKVFGLWIWGATTFRIPDSAMRVYEIRDPNKDPQVVGFNCVKDLTDVPLISESLTWDWGLEFLFWCARSMGWLLCTHSKSRAHQTLPRLCPKPETRNPKTQTLNPLWGWGDGLGRGTLAVWG